MKRPHKPEPQSSSHYDSPFPSVLALYTALTNSELAISSVPDGADIEVDDNFVGNTPSVVELVSGEHNVAVKKSGYKMWQRKIKLSGGEIKINAELEKN